MQGSLAASDDGGLPTWRQCLEALFRKYLHDWEPLHEHVANSQHVGCIEKNDGDIIFRKGDCPDSFFVILDGEVDICGESGVRIRGRGPGEVIGEQAFLLASQPGERDVCRSAGVRAHGPVRLLAFHADVLTGMSTELRAGWYEFMAHMLNEKLVEASDARAALMDERIAKSRLLDRFCDKEALSLVQMAFTGGIAPSPVKDTVVWFSDIAGFSSWAKAKDPAVVATAMKNLMGLQVDLIHTHNGAVDKLMGDGLMGFWFANSLKPDSISDCVRCAKQVIEKFQATVADTDMQNLSLRIGLHCGDACFGDFGTDGRIAVTLIGEPVNLAARYEQLRESEQNPGLGPIRISEELRDRIAAVDEALASEIQGPQEAKVKTDIFRVYWIGAS